MNKVKKNNLLADMLKIILKTGKDNFVNTLIRLMIMVTL